MIYKMWHSLALEKLRLKLKNEPRPFLAPSRGLPKARSAQRMLHAPTEESPRISAIRVMHFSIAPSIPPWGRGKDESKGDRERERDRDRGRGSYRTATLYRAVKIALY